MSDRTRQLLPAADDAERALISAALATPDLLDEAAALVPPEAMHLPAHRLVWEQTLAMHRERVPVDQVTLTQRFLDRALLTDIGGPGLLADLCAFGNPSNWRAYAETVREKHLLRQIITQCGAAARAAYESEAIGKDLLEQTITTLVELASARGGHETIRHVQEYALKALDEIVYAYQNRGATVGLPTGFVDLDRMIGGWQKGHTIYVGGRPAMGKSSLGLNFAQHVAAHGLAAGAPVLFYSIEMTGVQLAKRLIFTLAEINQQRARDGFLSKEADWDALNRAATAVASSRLEIDETAALTIADFRARTRAWIKRIRRRHGPRPDGKPDGLVIVDYLQRMKGSSKRSEDARYLELQEIAQGISQTAKELEIPCIILAQLKRPRDKKPDTEPDMTEFRECGDIEQEAHCVALIHRPHYYVKHSPEKQAALAEELQERFRAQARWQGDQHADAITFTAEDLSRYAKLIIDKQREGPVGPVDLRFIGDYTKFETWDPERLRYSNNKAHRQAVPVQEEFTS